MEGCVYYLTYIQGIHELEKYQAWYFSVQKPLTTVETYWIFFWLQHNEIQLVIVNLAWSIVWFCA